MQVAETKAIEIPTKPILGSTDPGTKVLVIFAEGNSSNCYWIGCPKTNI